MDLLCQKLICPICNSKMIESIESKGNVNKIYRSCQNTCYNLMHIQEFYNVIHSNLKIFGENENFYIFGRLTLKNEKNIIDKINYWREDDRYIAKILEGVT